MNTLRPIIIAVEVNVHASRPRFKHYPPSPGHPCTNAMHLAVRCCCFRCCCCCCCSCLDEDGGAFSRELLKAVPTLSAGAGVFDFDPGTITPSVVRDGDDTGVPSTLTVPPAFPPPSPPTPPVPVLPFSTADDTVNAVACAAPLPSAGTLPPAPTRGFALTLAVLAGPELSKDFLLGILSAEPPPPRMLPPDIRKPEPLHFGGGGGGGCGGDSDGSARVLAVAASLT